MCFHFTGSIEPQIAEEDIIVYKECRVVPIAGKYYLAAEYIDNYLYSKFEWSPFKIKRDMDYHYSRNSYEIYNGLHSNINRTTYTNTIWKIPKGAKYFKNDHQYVSTKLVFSSFCSGCDIYIEGEGHKKISKFLKENKIHFKRWTIFSYINSIFNYLK